jgi:glycosyltransferase involved in cell wall biosynthesis
MTSDARRAALSVVITNYNYGRFVADAIESALGQSQPVEVIVVDDGSVDDSPDVIAGYGDRIVAVFQPNGGQASAFNAGFRVSSGRVLLFLDADDVLEPDAADQLMAAFSEGVVHARWPLRMADAELRPIREVRPASPIPAGDLHDEIAAKGPVFIQGFPSGHAFAASFLETALPVPPGPYRNGGVDLYLTWLAAASGKVTAVDRPLSRYRRHGNSDGVSGSTDDRIDRGLGWSSHALLAVADRLGLDRCVAATWAQGEWWHTIDAARQAVRRHVPTDGRLLVADDYLWAVRESLGGRRAVQLAVDDPGVDPALVRRMELEVRAGPAYVVLPAFSSWWLEHYAGWAAWMRRRGRLLHRDRVVSIYVVGGDG